jgi:hypothetical protein
MNRGANLSAKHKSMRASNSHFIEELRNNLNNTASVKSNPQNSVLSLTSNKIGAKFINAYEMVDSMQKD